MAPSSGPRQGSLLWINMAGIGGCLAASLIGYAVIVGPFLQQRSAAADLDREMEARQKEAAGLDSAVATAQEQLALLEQELAARAIQMESAAHVNKRIAGITQFFSSCRLQVDDVQTGAVAAGPQYEVVPITIVGRGAYRQCAELLQGLYAKYPDMSVLRIDLAGNPAQGAESGKFRIELFWYAAPSGSGSRGM